MTYDIMFYSQIIHVGLVYVLHTECQLRMKTQNSCRFPIAHIKVNSNNKCEYTFILIILLFGDNDAGIKLDKDFGKLTSYGEFRSSSLKSRPNNCSLSKILIAQYPLRDIY